MILHSAARGRVSKARRWFDPFDPAEGVLGESSGESSQAIPDPLDGMAQDPQATITFQNASWQDWEQRTVRQLDWRRLRLRCTKTVGPESTVKVGETTVMTVGNDAASWVEWSGGPIAADRVYIYDESGSRLKLHEIEAECAEVEL